MKNSRKTIRIVFAFLLMLGSFLTLNEVGINAASGSASNGNGSLNYSLVHRMSGSNSTASATTSNSKNVSRITASFTIKNYYTGANMDVFTANSYNAKAVSISRIYGSATSISKQPTSAFSSHTTVHTYGYTYYLSQACQ